MSDADEDPAMTAFPVPDRDDLPDDLRERIAEETERAGFTPNVFDAFAYKPSHFRPFFAYYDALCEDTDLTRAEVEMIIVATSGANDCLYCVVAHGALLRVYADDPQLADQLATNYRSADLSEREEAMVAFAVKLTNDVERIDDADRQALREAGLSDEEIWDVAAVCAFFNLSNRMATVAGMRPNDEFYALGRD
ncbi:peroxidase-related enzyme [Halocalculus aciditolerans]|uniref:Alkyl hydroperoxide reductase AhpD n=1 Tax=Halocalculus aciditolerans TaxID=1383812 RepID=A0A830F6X8_9EURY|nr:peroxidase-related enzyme [Halocalculus aciditolerans]GGL60484.1 alkyl hydroperoxide reductase AhpD [Halocalculus aciditolerans]